MQIRQPPISRDLAFMKLKNLRKRRRKYNKKWRSKCWKRNLNECFQNLEDRCKKLASSKGVKRGKVASIWLEIRYFPDILLVDIFIGGCHFLEVRYKDQRQEMYDHAAHFLKVWKQTVINLRWTSIGENSVEK